MTRTLRRTLWIAGAVVAVLTGVALAIPYFVDINRYHDLIESQAEKALGRDISLGRMRLVLLPLPGVSVEPVSIASDRRGDPPLLKAASVSAHARLLPLLHGEIAVASLVANRPELNLHRYRDGTFNLPRMTAPAAAPGGAPAAPAKAVAGLSLARLRIHRARLRLKDEAVVPGKTMTTILDGVNVSLDGYAPGRPFRIELRTALPPRGSGSLSLAGTVALPSETPGEISGTTDVTLKLKKFQPSLFAPYIRKFVGMDPPLGSVSADLNARAQIRTVEGGKWELAGDGSLRGDIAFRDVALRPSVRGARPVRTGDLDLALDLSLGEGGKRVAFRKLEVSTGKTRLSAGGSLELGERTARIDVRVRPSRVMAGDIATVAAVLGAKFPAGLTSSAPITFSGSASGPLDQPERMRFQGEIALSGVRYADPTLGRPVEDVAGKLTFENGALQVSGFTARVNQTKVAGRLEVRDFQSPRVTLALSSSRANLDDLLALLTPSTPSAATASSSFAGGDDILARTRGAGTIRIDEGSFGTFRFSRFDGDLHLEGKVVTFDPVSFRLYGGTYRGALSADLRRAEPRYSYRSNLSAVNAQEFLGENLGIKDLLAGTVSADLTLDGGGSSLDRILNSLNGRGSIKVDKGWIGELNVLKGLAKASDLLGETTLAKVSREVSSARTDFSSLTGDLEIAGGRVTTRNLKALTKDLDLDGKGSFTLAGNLDLDLNVLFSRDLTQTMLQEGSRARYLDQRDGRIVLPLTIKGPLAAPAYGVDLRSIARSAARSGAVDRLAKSGSPLGELAAGLLGRKPGREAPPHANDGRPLAPAPNNKAPAGESPVAPGAGDSSIRISSHEYGGNFLLPDLTIRGEFSGVGLASADLKVDGKGGQTVVEKPDAFAEIAAYYAAHDRAAPARIPFRTKLDGKALAGAGDLRITITLHRSDGTSSVQTFTQKKRGL